MQTTISGSVETFDQESYKANLAASLGITADEITLTVSPASVIVVATIRPTTADVVDVEAAATVLVESSDVSTQLGVDVEAIEAPVKKQVVIPGPSAPPPALPPPPPSLPPSLVPCFMLPPDEWCFSLAHHGQAMCNKHFLLQQSGTSFRFCLWSDEDDKCKLEGETVSQFPSCTVQPPSPPSPPPIRSFDYTDCMQPISSQGVDWCYQLPEDTVSTALECRHHRIIRMPPPASPSCALT